MSNYNKKGLKIDFFLQGCAVLEHTASARRHLLRKKVKFFSDSETTSVLIAKGKDKEVLAIKETDAENAVTVQPEKLLENETTIGTSEVDKSMSKADKEDEISPTAIESDDKVTVSSSTTISDSKGIDIYCSNFVVVDYSTFFQGWGHGRRLWSPISRATSQGLDQRS